MLTPAGRMVALWEGIERECVARKYRLFHTEAGYELLERKYVVQNGLRSMVWRRPPEFPHAFRSIEDVAEAMGVTA